MKKLIAAFAALTLAACATQEASDEPTTAADTSSKAEADPNEPFQISKVSCWDGSSITDENAAYLYTIIYGYAAGVKGTSQLDVSDVERIVGDASVTCAENPDMSIYDAMIQSWN